MVPRWINKALAGNKIVIATWAGGCRRVTWVKTVKGEFLGRSTDGTWEKLPAAVLFKITP